ncbi:MAG: hypothetical protein WD407_04540 [Rhodospirillales bacterium]
MPKFKRTLIPISGVVYGDVIYWATIVASVMVVVGTVETFLTDYHVIQPGYLLQAVLEGNSISEIWEGSALKEIPRGHWYLDILPSGEGVTTAGLALGVFGVIPAIFISAFFLWRSHNVFFAFLAVVAGIITITSMLGIIPLPVG